MAKVLSHNGQKKIYKKIESNKTDLTQDILSLADYFKANGSNSIILEE